jgi:glutamyl/glutaminyl-tRNA synthetase
MISCIPIIPLIHGEDGKKLSKRNGAVDINEFKEKGYLQEAIINNLILLGWSPPYKKEIIGIHDIIKLFDINEFSKSSSIFSYNKLIFFNNFYIKDDNKFVKLLNYCKNYNILINYLNADLEKFEKNNKKKFNN